MEPQQVLSCATDTVTAFADKIDLNEFEMLAYEQACRNVESLLKSYRKAWERNNPDDFEGSEI